MENQENGTNVLKSKRFVVRLSLVGKNQLIEFVNKKGDTITYNHDKVYSIMKDKLESLDCFQKYKSYTSSTSVLISVKNRSWYRRWISPMLADCLSNPFLTNSVALGPKFSINEAYGPIF